MKCKLWPPRASQCSCTLCDQEKDAQLRQSAFDGRLDSSRCASCSHLCEELRDLRQRHRDVCDQMTQQEAEMKEVKQQLSKMTPYGASPLGRIRELELQFTQAGGTVLRCLVLCSVMFLSLLLQHFMFSRLWLACCSILHISARMLLQNVKLNPGFPLFWTDWTKHY